MTIALAIVSLRHAWLFGSEYIHGIVWCTHWCVMTTSTKHWWPMPWQLTRRRNVIWIEHIMLWNGLWTIYLCGESSVNPLPDEASRMKQDPLAHVLLAFAVHPHVRCQCFIHLMYSRHSYRGRGEASRSLLKCVRIPLNYLITNIQRGNSQYRSCSFHLHCVPAHFYWSDVHTQYVL